jgi:hypothetical protein
MERLRQFLFVGLSVCLELDFAAIIKLCFKKRH